MNLENNGLTAVETSETSTEMQDEDEYFNFDADFAKSSFAKFADKIKPNTLIDFDVFINNCKEIFFLPSWLGYRKESSFKRYIIEHLDDYSTTRGYVFLTNFLKYGFETYRVSEFMLIDRKTCAQSSKFPLSH